MLYGIKGFSADRKYAASKIIISDPATADRLQGLGFQFVDKDTFDSVQLLDQRSPTAKKIAEMAEALDLLLSGVTE